MKEKIKIQKAKSIIFGILIGIIAFPIVTLGGTFVSSLIQGKTVEEAVQILAIQIDSLIGRVEVLEIQQKKEKACRKAEELKIAPHETKVAYHTEQKHIPIYASWAPNTTEALLEYLHGYMKNYQETGSRYYVHNPDYDPELVPKYISILENRWQEYLIQKQLCEQP